MYNNMNMQVYFFVEYNMLVELDGEYVWLTLYIMMLACYFGQYDEILAALLVLLPCGDMFTTLTRCEAMVG